MAVGLGLRVPSGEAHLCRGQRPQPGRSRPSGPALDQAAPRLPERANAGLTEAAEGTSRHAAQTWLSPGAVWPQVGLQEGAWLRGRGVGGAVSFFSAAALLGRKSCPPCGVCEHGAQSRAAAATVTPRTTPSPGKSPSSGAARPAALTPPPGPRSLSPRTGVPRVVSRPQAWPRGLGPGGPHLARPFLP